MMRCSRESSLGGAEMVLKGKHSSTWQYPYYGAYSDEIRSKKAAVNPWVKEEQMVLEDFDGGLEEKNMCGLGKTTMF